MDSDKQVSRRKFLKLAGTAALSTAIAACAPTAAPPTSAPATAAPTAAPAIPTAAPTVAKARNVRISVGAWAEQNMKDLLAKTDFAKQTGITPEIVLRTDTKETELARLSSAVQAGTSDGASLPQIFWRILLPVTLPGVVTMGVINFINAWNNLLYPLSFTTSPSAKPLSVAITEIFNGYSPYGKPWELIMTVGVTMTVPIVILVLFSQRAIIRGLVSGAIK